MKKRGPVCDCPNCYSLWAKEEIERLEAEATQHIEYINSLRSQLSQAREQINEVVHREVLR